MHTLQNSNLIIIGYSFATISVILASYWDIFIDWRLDQKRTRDVVGPTVYLICLVNILLRLASIPFLSKLMLLTMTFSNGSEILRRALWVHLRLVNHLSDQEAI